MDLTENNKLIRTLQRRLNQASKTALAAETCSIEEPSTRVQDLLENVEELVRDANHLVQASLMLQYLDLEKTGRKRPD
ncbi:MAG: hypothetical protein ABJO86_13265 [Lentilitoribacter sp.]